MQDATEKKIVNKLVSNALHIGYKISVFDGEEFVVKKVSNKAKIIKALASTDEDLLVFHKPDGEWIGGVSLIWGNGEDLISDYSDNELTNALVASVAA